MAPLSLNKILGQADLHAPMDQVNHDLSRETKEINSLRPKSDQSQFSLNIINRQSRDNIVRINEMTTWWGKVLISKQILSANSLRKCMEISLQNLYLDIGAY